VETATPTPTATPAGTDTPVPTTTVTPTYTATAASTPIVEYGAAHYRDYDLLVGYVPMFPDLAQFLRNNLLTETQNYVRDYTFNDPWWFTSDLSYHKAGGAIEELYSDPKMSFSIFQTKAYVLGESYTFLKSQLPWSVNREGYRDRYRLQNLVTLLKVSDGSLLTSP